MDLPTEEEGLIGWVQRILRERKERGRGGKG